jgi:hypothetical protein
MGSFLDKIYQPSQHGILCNGAFLFSFLYALTYLDRSFKKDARLWKPFQHLSIWNYFRDYFNGSVVLETPLDHSKQYMFCAFPHGTSTASHILTMTDCCGMLSEHYKGDRRDLCASILFSIPVLKDLLLWCGCVDANNKTAQYNLSKGRSLYIYVGGEKEQLLTEYGDRKVYTRKENPGFIRLALQYGIPLVPMYTFGETSTHYTSRFLYGFRSWLQEKFHIGIPIFWGRWFSIFPLKTKLTVEIGAPIHVPTMGIGSQISDEDLKKYHAIFETELVRLYNRTKERNGCLPTDELEFIREAKILDKKKN